MLNTHLDSVVTLAANPANDFDTERVAVSYDIRTIDGHIVRTVSNWTPVDDEGNDWPNCTPEEYVAGVIAQHRDRRYYDDKKVIVLASVHPHVNRYAH